MAKKIQEAKYISLFEAAKLTSYSQDYISLLCRQKKLKGTKIGRNWVTKKSWIEEYVNRIKEKGKEISSAQSKEKESSNKKKKTNNSKIGTIAKISPAIGRLLLASLSCLLIGSFLFLQNGFQYQETKLESANLIQGINKTVVAEMNAISESLNLAKKESTKLAFGFVVGEDIDSTTPTTPSQGGDQMGSTQENGANSGDENGANSGDENRVNKELENNTNYEIGFNLVPNIGREIGGVFVEVPMKTGSKISDTGFAIFEKINEGIVEIASNAQFVKENYNLDNAIETKLARLSQSKDIVLAAVFERDNFMQDQRGRVAGIASDDLLNLEESQNVQNLQDESTQEQGASNEFQADSTQDNENNEEQIVSKSKTAFDRIIEQTQNGIISVSNFLDKNKKDTINFAIAKVDRLNSSIGIIKNESVKFVFDRVGKFNNSFTIVKKEAINFAIAKVDRLNSSIGIIKNESVKFVFDRVDNFNNSFRIVKKETIRFATAEVDELYYSLDFLKGESEKVMKTVLATLSKGQRATQVVQSVDNSSLQKAETEEPLDNLEQKIIDDIQKRFDQFQGDESLPENYGAVIAPYSDLEDKEKKIANLKESFSDSVTITEDEESQTGTIVPDIPGEDQSYLYLMVPVGQ